MSGCGRCAKTGEWECIYCNSHMLDAELKRLKAKIVGHEMVMLDVARRIELEIEYDYPPNTPSGLYRKVVKQLRAEVKKKYK